jgi:adenylate cyclase
LEEGLESEQEQIIQLTIENLKLKGLLEEHLGKKIAEGIIDGKFSTKLGGERKKLGILMADLRNFTSYSEREEPEKVVEFLNNFFRVMTSIVEKYGGIVDKFIGDAVLAIFYENDISKMIYCAREMISSFSKLEKIPNLNVGIGMASGEVILGYVGSGRKVDFTVIGSAVNLASRLSSLAEAGEVLLDENLSNIFPPDLIEFLAEKGIKGFSKKIKIFKTKK